MPKTVEMLIFDGMNELDFAAMYDMLTSVEVVMPNARAPQKGFDVATVADKMVPVETAHGLKFSPQKSLSASLSANVLIIPGGPGARKPIVPPNIIQWITRNMGAADLICTASTGVYMLGRAGIINDRRVTTHYSLLEDLQRAFPRAKVIGDQRVALDGRNLLTSSGGSAAIDLSLAIIERFYGSTIAQHAANRVEFPYQPPPANRMQGPTP